MFSNTQPYKEKKKIWIKCYCTFCILFSFYCHSYFYYFHNLLTRIKFDAFLFLFKNGNCSGKAENFWAHDLVFHNKRLHEGTLMLPTSQKPQQCVLPLLSSVSFANTVFAVRPFVFIFSLQLFYSFHTLKINVFNFSYN